MICGLTLYQILWYFIEYSFIGWVIEVIYHAVAAGKIINRGFLNGPVCPIYGTGMIGVLMLTNMISSALASAGYTSEPLRLLCVFAGGTLFATAVELAGGWLLDKLFHARWWDYSDRKFNLGGYICPEFSMMWGLGILFVVEIVQPFLAVEPTHGIIAHAAGIVVLAVVYTVFVIDCVATVLTIRGLNKKLAEIDEISAAIRQGSDYITDKVGNRAYKTTVKLEEGAVQARLGYAELKDKVAADKVEFDAMAENTRKELIARRDRLYAELTRERHWGVGRLLNAFPMVKHEKYAEALREIMEKRIGSLR